jgi:hypothetical protein
MLISSSSVQEVQNRPATVSLGLIGSSLMFTRWDANAAYSDYPPASFLAALFQQPE